jgi:hypothetical protein
VLRSLSTGGAQVERKRNRIINEKLFHLKKHHRSTRDLYKEMNQKQIKNITDQLAGE